MKKEYKPKSIMTGFKLGFKDDKANKKFYAVPVHNLPTKVLVFNHSIDLTIDTPFVYSNTFEDKFGRGNYTLRYYEVPDKQS